MNPWKTALAAAGAAALLAAAATGAGAAGTKTCHPAKYPGTGYITSVKVTGVTCAKGNQVAVAYYRCRIKNGGVQGHCKAKVLGFTCKESARQAIPTEFDARVTCTKGHQKVVHTYQQNL